MICSKCNLPNDPGPMGTVLPQCICQWKHTPYNNENFPPVEVHDPLTQLKREWYELNNQSTEGMNPRDLGFHVGMKAGLLKAINILSGFSNENHTN